jgi:hypothetical protein
MKPSEWLSKTKVCRVPAHRNIPNVGAVFVRSDGVRYMRAPDGSLRLVDKLLAIKAAAEGEV